MNGMTEAKLRELGIKLPDAPAAVAAYEPWVRTGNIIQTSGQLPWRDGKMAFEGKLGAGVSDADGYQAARQCALNALAQLRNAAGSLDHIARILRIEGYVHCAPGFRGHPQVLNGASDLINAIFGDRGKHSRLALGINEMPLNAAVQLSVTAEVIDCQRIGIAHITLATRQLQTTRDFFVNMLGCRDLQRPNNIGTPAVWLSIGGQHEIHLLEIPDFEISQFEREYGRHIAFEFPTSQFATIKARLQMANVEILAPQRTTPFERFFFRDPNGYMFEIIASDRTPEA